MKIKSILGLLVSVTLLGFVNPSAWAKDAPEPDAAVGMVQGVPETVEYTVNEMTAYKYNPGTGSFEPVTITTSFTVEANVNEIITAVGSSSQITNGTFPTTVRVEIPADGSVNLSPSEFQDFQDYGTYTGATTPPSTTTTYQNNPRTRSLGSVDLEFETGDLLLE